MEEQNQPSKLRRILTNIALVLMLAVMPAMSWFYLNSGANVYRGIMSEIGEYGDKPTFELSNYKGEVIKSSSFDKNLQIFNFSTSKSNEEHFGGMKYVYEQFIDNPEVLFATFSQEKLDSLSFSKKLEKENIQPKKWEFLMGDSNEIEQLKTNGFIIPDSILNFVDNVDNALILIDTNSVVRNFYSSTDSVQLNKMITTMSLLMPRPEKAKIKFERETEK